MNPLYALASHALGDFPLQTKGMAATKLNNPAVRAIHVAVYTAAYVPALALSEWDGKQSVAFIAVIASTHFAIDSDRWNEDVPIWYDQALHIIALAIAAGIADAVEEVEIHV